MYWVGKKVILIFARFFFSYGLKHILFLIGSIFAKYILKAMKLESSFSMKNSIVYNNINNINYRKR